MKQENAGQEGEPSAQQPRQDQPAEDKGPGVPVPEGAASDKPRRKGQTSTGRTRVYPVFHRYTNPNLVPSAQRVHPKGFRILTNGSPIERAMTTYFRLAPRAPPRVANEQQKLENQIKTMIKQDSKQSAVLLDGFMLLDATQVEVPSQARECVINNSNVTGVVADELSLFSNLTFLDLGENQLRLTDFAPLLNLEELHLHCNNITEIQVPDREDMTVHQEAKEGAEGANDPDLAPLCRLHTLNLSFNSVHPNTILELGTLPALERLDLSCNGLRRIPMNLSILQTLRQFALENNKFSKADIFTALSTLPVLAELNLNGNQLTCVPRIPEGGFPALETLGLAANKVEYFEDLYPLTQIHSLRCLVLYNNPIERRKKDKEILFYEFNNINVQIVMEPPVPPKRNVGAFYVANTTNFVKVHDFKRLPTRTKKGSPKKAPPPPTVPEEEGPEGETFFMTQASAQQHGQPQQGSQPGTPRAAQEHTANVEGGHYEGTSSTGLAGTTENPSWIGNWGDVEPTEIVGARTGHFQSRGAGIGATPSYSQEYSSAARARGPEEPPAFAEMPASGDGDGSFLPDISQPRGNLRSTLTELKRMLRQPLPPLSTARFASSSKRGY